MYCMTRRNSFSVFLFITALSLRTSMSPRDDLRLATVFWCLGMIKYETNSFKDAMKHLGDFVKIQDAKKIRNIEYVIALTCIGDIHQHLESTDSSSSAWSAAFHTYSSSKDLVSRYPELGPMLERRQESGGGENEAPPSQPETMLQTITASLVGQLSEEVNEKQSLDRDPAEAAFYRAIFLED